MPDGELITTTAYLLGAALAVMISRVVYYSTYRYLAKSPSVDYWIRLTLSCQILYIGVSLGTALVMAHAVYVIILVAVPPPTLGGALTVSPKLLVAAFTCFALSLHAAAYMYRQYVPTHAYNKRLQVSATAAVAVASLLIGLCRVADLVFKPLPPAAAGPLQLSLIIGLVLGCFTYMTLLDMPSSNDCQKVQPPSP